MIAIYTPYNSNRLNYVLNYIFKQQYGVEYNIYNTLQDFEVNSFIKINYSESAIENTFHILPNGLLTETSISEKTIVVEKSNNFPIIFKTHNDDLGFDIFSAIFYCLSRYEEYTCNLKDEYGRFPHKASFLWQNNCLELPLVDQWVNYFSDKLNIKVKNEFKILPTIDIDAAFAYKGRGIARQLAGFGKAFLSLNFAEIPKRFKVICHFLPDPNDNFDYQLAQLKKATFKAHYFIQVGKYGKYDKNISPTNKGFIKLIKDIHKAGHTIGIHPSYASANNIEIVKKEIAILEKIIGAKITTSRQHYLKMEMPITYQNLIQLGITHDFTMGYSQVFGYRASTSKPFFWYDINNEQQTELTIVPFCTMDVVHKQFLKQNVEDTLAISEKIKQQIKSIGGNFCFVFHNESLSEHRGWQGWKAVFEQWLK